jgi:diguanylate cyclase (GGDEF)-like protein
MAQPFAWMDGLLPRSLAGRAGLMALLVSAGVGYSVHWAVRSADAPITAGGAALIHGLAAKLLDGPLTASPSLPTPSDAAALAGDTAAASQPANIPPGVLAVARVGALGVTREWKRHDLPEGEIAWPAPPDARERGGLQRVRMRTGLEGADYADVWMLPASDGPEWLMLVYAPASSASFPAVAYYLAPAGAALLALMLAPAIVGSSLRRITSALQSGVDAEILANIPAPREAAELVALLTRLRRDEQKARSEAAALRHSLEYKVDARTRAAERAAERATREATSDPLTQLSNRRALNQELPELFKRQVGRGDELTVAVIDVDNFKILNDTQGHGAGDELLAFLGQLLRAGLPTHGRAYRTGGDEFVLLLPEVRPHDAARLVGRLQSLFAQRVRTLQTEEPRADLSCGISSLLEDGAGEPTELLELADKAMYLAKSKRSRIATVSELNAAVADGKFKLPAGLAVSRR